MTTPPAKTKRTVPGEAGLGSKLLSPVTHQILSSHGLCLWFQVHRTWIGWEINAEKKFSRGSFLININLCSGVSWDAGTTSLLVLTNWLYVHASTFWDALSSHQKGCFKIAWSLFVLKRLRLMLSSPASSDASAVIILNTLRLKLSNRKQ